MNSQLSWPGERSRGFAAQINQLACEARPRGFAAPINQLVCEARQGATQWPRTRAADNFRCCYLDSSWPTRRDWAAR
jgi:hypothetical protein